MFDNIQLLPFSEGDMTICSPEAGNIARGGSPRAILPVKGEQIVMPPSLKGKLFYYTEPFLKEISNIPQDKHVTTSATAPLGEYDVKG